MRLEIFLVGNVGKHKSDVMSNFEKMKIISFVTACIFINISYSRQHRQKIIHSFPDTLHFTVKSDMLFWYCEISCHEIFTRVCCHDDYQMSHSFQFTKWIHFVVLKFPAFHPSSFLGLADRQRRPGSLPCCRARIWVSGFKVCWNTFSGKRKTNQFDKKEKYVNRGLFWRSWFKQTFGVKWKAWTGLLQLKSGQIHRTRIYVSFYIQPPLS